MLDHLRRIPWTIFACCAGITIIGLFGLHRADSLYGASRLFERQLIWISLSWPAMFAVTLVPYRLLRSWSVLIYTACVLLLIVPLLLSPINGSRRWIPLGVFDFQPSEPARLAFILVIANYLMHHENRRTWSGLIPPFVLTLLPLLLILREPDLGTALLFLPVLFAMLFAAGESGRHLMLAAATGMLCLPFLWQQMNAEQQSRVVSVFTQHDGGAVPAGDGFHLHQSKQVLALHGPLGSVVRDELVTDDPAAWRLPAARTDFIFSLIGERYGILGCAILLFLYAVLILRGLRTARNTREPFGRLVAVGIVVMLAVQVVINTGMTVGLMPITGITLPMCSYGGSSLLSTSLAIGLLMNITMRPGYEVTDEPFAVRAVA
jgi:rod shape determining protein RodA